MAEDDLDYVLKEGVETGISKVSCSTVIICLL